MNREFNLASASKFLALVLRHKPEVAGIALDEHGWADVDALLEGMQRKYPIDSAVLERIVAEDDKQRYSFNEDHTLIRANQGHSVPVDIELEQLTPPDVLYHGTGEKFVMSIRKQGLIPKSRLYVHLSTDAETALAVGKRRGKPHVFTVDSAAMAREGFTFFRSHNGVWLTKRVPPEFLYGDEGETGEQIDA